MGLAGNLLGKIFLSHSSKDKPFARKLTSRLKKEGYKVWLDEHELLAGDPLAQQISEALANANVVLVVVSSVSVKSKWLKFELNKATERMVQGHCRVIPVIKDKVDLPPEVRALLYADFTSSFTYGLRSVRTSLEHEANRKIQEHGFWAQIETGLEAVFPGKGSVSLDSEYNSKDYNVVSLNARSGRGENIYVAYEIVRCYASSRKSLTTKWWKEYESAIREIPERFFLVVTERPIKFPVVRASVGNSAVFVKELRGEHKRVVIVDLSRVANEASRLDLLMKAKDVLVTFAGAKSQRKNAAKIRGRSYGTKLTLIRYRSRS